jgi:tetratricopeptide (TPR) repeat protein
MATLAVAIFALIGWAYWDSRENPVRQFNETWSSAQISLREGRAADAERALIRATALRPEEIGPWLQILEILRVEDRTLEATQIGWAGLASVPRSQRLPVLRAMTLAILAGTPEELARQTLQFWTHADPNDLEAEVALLKHIESHPRVGDPTRPERIARLKQIVENHPEHGAAREALVVALLDAGAPDEARLTLDAWPPTKRDVRYHRLHGRWSLEFDTNPDRESSALESFEHVIEIFPYDWRSWYRLARAYKRLGRDDAAETAATLIAKLRDTLDPTRLAERLDHSLGAIQTREARLDLADLCQSAGLTRLAEQWRAEADSLTEPHSNPLQGPSKSLLPATAAPTPAHTHP